MLHAGLVGFNTDMGATKGSMHSESSSIIATVRTGMQEIEERWGQPYRAQLWKYIFPVSITTQLMHHVDVVECWQLGMD